MAKSKLQYPIVNSVTLLITLCVNYWSNTGAISDQTVGGVSNQYASLFTPAGYAFSIWGFIYLFLIGFVVFQWYSWKSGKSYDISLSGWWLAIANVLNAVWILLWVNEYILWSVVAMLGILYSLIRLAERLAVFQWSNSRKVVVFVWWPVSWYLGWIVVATVANISVFLKSLAFDMILPEATWTIIMIGVASLIYTLLIWKRNYREVAMMGIWGFVGIAVKQWEVNPPITFMAIGTSLMLTLYLAIHAYRNWGRKVYI